jgi:hypothetical protein
MNDIMTALTYDELAVLGAKLRAGAAAARSVQHTAEDTYRNVIGDLTDDRDMIAMDQAYSAHDYARSGRDLADDLSALAVEFNNAASPVWLT